MGARRACYPRWFGDSASLIVRQPRNWWQHFSNIVLKQAPGIALSGTMTGELELLRSVARRRRIAMFFFQEGFTYRNFLLETA